VTWASSNSYIDQRMIVHLCVLGIVVSKTGNEMEHVHGIPSTSGPRDQEYESSYGAILMDHCKPSAELLDVVATTGRVCSK